jgi:hypothetical protein
MPVPVIHRTSVRVTVRDVTASVPPGWPAEVPSPGTDSFTEKATGFLLDALPPGYRDHDVFRRWPAALASLAHYHMEAVVVGHRQGFRTARTELGEYVPPHAIDAVLSAYRTEGQRLAAEAQSVDLVARALRSQARGASRL